MAKYFWSKGVEDYRLMQDMLYLTYREVLKKQGKVLFKEKFQAWEDCPVLESVHQQMKHHFKEYRTMDYLFEPVEDIEDKEIKQHLTKIYRDYQTAKKKGDIDFFSKARMKPEKKPVSRLMEKEDLIFSSNLLKLSLLLLKCPRLFLILKT